LPQALDADVFAIVSTRISKESLSKCHILDQTRGISDAGDVADKVDHKSTHVPSTRVVAVVDRSANIPDAASIIGASRAAFNGQSDYSPGLVLVNEFVADDFLFHLTQAIISPVQGGKAISNSSRHSKGARDGLNQLQGEIERNDNLKVIISGENGSIVEIRDR
jgi:hypothetical protein